MNRVDFVVFNRDGQLVAMAEAKNKRGASPRWAADWFRNYLADQPSFAPPFTLLITPEKLYLWKRTAEQSSPEPTDAFDAQHLFASYLDRSHLDPAELSGQTFEFLVGAWLDDLTQRIWQPTQSEERRVLVDSGFLDAVTNGRVVSDIAA
jgi:hypothetical protein